MLVEEAEEEKALKYLLILLFPGEISFVPLTKDDFQILALLKA